jgi:hypothetical protein
MYDSVYLTRVAQGPIRGTILVLYCVRDAQIEGGTNRLP